MSLPGNRQAGYSSGKADHAGLLQTTALLAHHLT
jgi:hypothetical protein